MPTAGLPAGVKALDLWSKGQYGSVLFWLDRNRDLSIVSHGRTPLYHHDAEHYPDGGWRSTGGGSHSTYEPGQILANKAPGIHKLGGGTRDPVRVTIGIATHDVAAIRLRDKAGAHERPPGADGFFLLGITHQDPITYVYAIDSGGKKKLPSEPILL